MLQIFDFHPDSVAILSPYAVVRHDGNFRLIAAAAIGSGVQLFRIEGLETRTPSFASVQVGPELHIDMDPALDLTAQMDLYPWRFMNHRCDPNCIIADRAVIARRAIQAGEELTFDYESNEYDMAEPFECGCNSAGCVGLIRGWKHRLQD
jgi:SET domain